MCEHIGYYRGKCFAITFPWWLGQPIMTGRFNGFARVPSKVSSKSRMFVMSAPGKIEWYRAWSWRNTHDCAWRLKWCLLCTKNVCHIHIYLWIYIYIYIWVCPKIGYIPNYSHVIGIMISKTIGFRGTLFSDTPIYIYIHTYKYIQSIYYWYKTITATGKTMKHMVTIRRKNVYY